LARSAGLSVETIRRIENGSTASPELFTFAAIARSLDVSIDGIVEKMV
jgi:transcriptional regulator with XRE-family HTH domain